MQPIERALLSAASPGCPLALCVSGGKDSSAMLHAVSGICGSFQYTPEVIHFNHGLRKESFSDEEFVKNASADAGFRFISYTLDVKGHASASGCSIEESARILRYGKLKEYASDRDTAGLIFTAHTADDQAETLTLRFIKGAGRTGFQGIRRSLGLPGGWSVRRPFLDITTEGVLSYIGDNKIKYVVDKSNSDTGFQRNFVRHRLIPVMKQLNPALAENFSRQASVFAAEEKYLDALAADALEGIQVERKKGRKIIELRQLISYNPWLRRRLLRKLAPVELDFAGTEALERLLHRDGASRSEDIGRGWIARKEYSALIFERSRPVAPEFDYPLHPGEKTVIAEAGRAVCLRLADPSREAAMPPEGIERYDAAGVDLAQLRARSRRPGDIFSPWGMSGAKKVKDLLIDLKVPLEERGRLVIIEAGQAVLWAAPHRRSSEAPVNENTEKVLEIEIKNV